MLFVALLAVVASASASLRPPVFSSTENCGFLPLRPPSAPMAPPDPRVSEDVLCKDVKCPRVSSVNTILLTQLWLELTTVLLSLGPQQLC
jgi:hypothetical protein